MRTMVTSAAFYEKILGLEREIKQVNLSLTESKQKNKDTQTSINLAKDLIYSVQNSCQKVTQQLKDSLAKDLLSVNEQM